MKNVVLALVSLGLLLLAGGGAAASDQTSAGDWLSFGRTTDSMRHSPLTLITPANVSQLGRVYDINLQSLDKDVRRGEQSYPLALDGTLYETTNDGQVFAINGATGKVLWHFKPANSGLFKNFGIVANRGLAYCDGALFLLTLDMHLNKLDPKTGALEGRVAIGAAVPGAGSNYGYSETSAPICAGNRVIAGAAGSEYGVRGYVMAWTTDLRPAWPNPVWTIPPEQQSWRSQSRVVGGGAVWTPVTVDTSTNTVFFGTGSATPLYFPQLRPGTNPRTDSLVAVDLKTGQLKWWRQLIAGNEWSYDVSQPPLVYTGKVGGTVHHVVSVATMEGVWFAFDASTGQPFYQRVKVLDRIEHPALQPGKPVAVYPSSIGGLNYSPASYDPSTDYVINAAAETAAVEVQSELTPSQKKNKFVLGSVFLGLENGNFGQLLPGWHDHGSISAIDVNTGKRVWKFETTEPERGGVTTTASSLGFAGGGDGVLRAFDTKTGKVLWTFQTGHQIAAGPTVFTGDDGKEYLAISVGGTPTSSNGGVASELQVFGLGGSQKQSTPPVLMRTFQPAAAPAPHGSFASAPTRSAPHVHGCGKGIASADLDGGAARGSPVGRERSEHGPGQRAAAPRRKAGAGGGDGGRRLHAAEANERRRALLLPRRHDDPAAPRRSCRAPGERDRERSGVDGGGADRAHPRVRSVQRRVPAQQPSRELEQRARRRDRPHLLRQRPATTARRPLHVPPVRDDHRRGRASRRRRDSRHADSGSQLLDVLDTERRKRALRILLHRIRPGRRGPCAAHRPGRIGGDLLCVADRKERQLRRSCTAQR